MLKPAVLWLHGLGDTGAGWRGAFGPLTNAATFHHPTAPVQPLSSPVHMGERMTSWFDIATWPIGLDEPEGPAGVDDTVKAIHGMLDEIAAGGVPTENIVLGGFSQGGTVSVLAGLTYPKKLGGIISISGWGAYREGLAAKVSDANRQTPMWYSAGMGDPIVVAPLTQKTGAILTSIMGEAVQVTHFQRGSHPPPQEELMGAAAFMKTCLKL